MVETPGDRPSIALPPALWPISRLQLGWCASLARSVTRPGVCPFTRPDPQMRCNRLDQQTVKSRVSPRAQSLPHMTLDNDSGLTKRSGYNARGVEQRCFAGEPDERIHR
jgi:hypothetical protein